jgi:hypothetical protein
MVNNLEDLIALHFGTKDSCAKRMQISRWTLYRWLAKPDLIPLKYINRLSNLTGTNACELIHLTNKKTGLESTPAAS